MYLQQTTYKKYLRQYTYHIPNHCTHNIYIHQYARCGSNGVQKKLMADILRLAFS